MLLWRLVRAAECQVPILRSTDRSCGVHLMVMHANCGSEALARGREICSLHPAPEAVCAMWSLRKSFIIEEPQVLSNDCVICGKRQPALLLDVLLHYMRVHAIVPEAA